MKGANNTMPIQESSFEDGILICRESGRIDANDAQKFEQIVYAHANMSLTPIVVLIDAIDVELITPDANKIFLRTASIPNIRGHVVVTRNLIATQSARVLAIRNREKNTYIYESFDEALKFAKKLLEQSATQG